MVAIGGGEIRVEEVAGVAGLGGFEEEDLGFGVGQGAVFDAAGDDAAFAGLKDDAAVAEFDGHLAAPDEEHFIFMFVVVPGEGAGEFGEFDFLAIELGDDFGAPVLVNEGEFFGEGDGFHGEAPEGMRGCIVRESEMGNEERRVVPCNL